MLTPEHVATSIPLSLRAYARRRATSVEAVRRAIKGGRLKASLVKDGRGQTKIGDAALADREWTANTDLSKAPGYIKARADAAVTPADGVTAAVTDDETVSLSLSAASALEKEWRAKLAELEYKRKSGLLVDAKAIEAHVFDVFTQCRTKLLGVPSKAKAALPHLTHSDVLVIDRLVREALEALATTEAGAAA